MKKKQIPKIAKNLKEFKKQKGWSQTDLCTKAELAYHTIAKIEAGATPDPRLSTLKKIAAAFEITIDKLIS